MTRDGHLFGPGPKRILSLDGGGTRGIVALAFLDRIEALLRERHGPGMVLSDYFDLIGGTSTGAIIAAALALGMDVDTVRRIYLDLAPSVFRAPFWRIRPWAAKFSHAPLAARLRAILGERTLDSADLRTGLAVVAKRLDTGSPWLIANNPRAPFWDDPADRAFLGNRHYHLASVIRASTAAPMFFRPERLPILAQEAPGRLADGGVSPYNNPAIMLLLMSQLRAFGLRWPVGADRLLMVSVGTGSYRQRLGPAVPRTAAVLAANAIVGLIADSQLQAIMLLQALSEPADPVTINAEIGDLRGDVLGGTPLLSFQRYDLALESASLVQEHGLQLGPAELARLRRFDDIGSMQTLHTLAVQTAARQVKATHFPPAFDRPES